LSATGTGTLQLSAGDNIRFRLRSRMLGHHLVVVQFTVNAQYPPPAVTITSRRTCAVFTYVAGSPPPGIPFAFTAQAAAGATISSLNASLNGTAVTVTSTGLGTASAAGTGTLQVSAAGTYTFTAGAVGGGTSGSSQMTFTVNVTQPPPPPCNLVWLPPSRWARSSRVALLCRSSSRSSAAAVQTTSMATARMMTAAPARIPR